MLIAVIQTSLPRELSNVPKTKDIECKSGKNLKQTGRHTFKLSSCHPRIAGLPDNTVDWQ
jgi:hypothetical protein